MPRLRARPAAAMLLLAVVLGLHLLLLRQVSTGSGIRPPRTTHVALHVMGLRPAVLPAQAPEYPAAATPPVPTLPAAAPVRDVTTLPPPAPPRQAQARPMETADVHRGAESPTGDARPAEALPATDDAPSAAQTVPIYPARVPPSVQLDYTVQRGDAQGRGKLAWAVSGPDYALQLQAQVAGHADIDWASAGQLDDSGAAPVRMAERRRGREVSAVNFQRAKGVISYSASTLEVPLVGAMQDRVSWIAQLAAVLAARPSPPAEGDRLLFWVTGTRSAPEIWAFEVIGTAPLHLRREPARPYDTRVDVWPLAAAHHLPGVLQMVTVPGGVLTTWRLTVH